MGWLTPISLQSFFVIRKYSVHLLHIILMYPGEVNMMASKYKVTKKYRHGLANEFASEVLAKNKNHQRQLNRARLGSSN